MMTSKYVPQFAIEINGSQVPSGFRACVTSIRLQSGMTGADRFEFGLFNENLRWLDHALIKPGNKVRLRIGYAPDQLPLMFSGELVGVQASFPSSGMPTMQLTAQDALADMQKSQQTRGFSKEVPQTSNIPTSGQELVRKVLADYGMQPQFDSEGGKLAAIVGSLSSLLSSGLSMTDPSVPQRGIDMQVKSNDYDLLKKIAAELGYDIFMDHASGRPNILLFFGPWQNLQPAVELRYGRSLQDFTPRESDVGQLTGATANVWLSEFKMNVAITLNWDWNAMVFSLSIEKGKAEPGKQDKSLVIDEPLTLGTAPRRLVSELLPKLNSRTTGSGSAVGDPKIRPGAVIQIGGVGEQFGGFYRVTGCTHSVDSSGYQTQFDVRKEVWFNISKATQGAVKVNIPASLRRALARQ